MEVDPIRDLGKITEMKMILNGKGGRDRLLFIMGINTALRISDLLSLTVGDVMDNEGHISNTVELKEKKTRKTKRFPLNESVRSALSDYLTERQGCNRSEPLFPSQKGGTLGRGHAWRIINAAGKSVGLENIGTHSLRKTFAYHVYKMTGEDIGLVQKLLNHSVAKITLRYIGIDRERMDKAFLDLNL
ncbi:MAG: tyrosine-type recombinase/integrase [Synergistaceae bacterium]|nr:tyrosine-type recombinase/integrase [Synergistaceae bacterium]